MQVTRAGSLRLLVMAAVCGAFLAGDQSPSTPQTVAAAEMALPLHFIMDVPVRPAGAAFASQTPRMDYQTIDPARRTLFVAYMGADEIIVFNIASNKVQAHITDVRNVHGVLAVPELHRLYASATGTNELVVIDEDIRRRREGRDRVACPADPIV